MCRSDLAGGQGGGCKLSNWAGGRDDAASFAIGLGAGMMLREVRLGWGQGWWCRTGDLDGKNGTEGCRVGKEGIL